MTNKPQFVGEKQSLENRVEYVRGVTYKAAVDLHEELDENGYVLLRANNIQEGELRFDDVQYVDRTKVKPKQLLRRGDILFCASSGSKGLVGKAALVRESMPVTFGAFCCVLRPKGNEAEYLGHYFQSRQYRRAIEEVCSGSNINNLKAANFLSLIVPNYDGDSTRAISALFDLIDAQVKQAKDQIAQLDFLVKSRFVEMFEGGQEWELRTLAECCATSNDIKCGPFGSQLHKEDYVSEGVPVWGIPEVNSNFERMPDKYVSPENGLRLQSYSLVPGDVAMNRKGNVGQAALFDGKRPSGIIHSDVLRVRVNQDVLDPVFLVEQLHSSHVVREQVLSASTGAIMAGTNVTKLKKIKVFAPPLALQHEFANFVSQVDKSRFIAQQQIEKLQMLYDSLAQEYFGD